MEEVPVNRRKNYYIKKRFQRNFILKFCALVAAGSVISGAIIYFATVSTVTTTFENCRLAIKTTADYILPAVVLSSSIMTLIIGLASIAITLFTSHKIAGPLYRIEKDLGELASGNLNVRFMLRGQDEIKELAASLDLAALSLREKFSALKSAADLVEASAKDASPEIKKNVQTLKDAVSKFNA